MLITSEKSPKTTILFYLHSACLISLVFHRPFGSCQSISWTETSPAVVEDSKECQVNVTPSRVLDLSVGVYKKLHVNCTCCQDYNGKVLMVHILAADPQVAAPTHISKRQQNPHTAIKPTCSYSAKCTSKSFEYGKSSIFVEANNVGRTRFKVEIVVWNISDVNQILNYHGRRKLEKDDSVRQQVLASTEVEISTLRKQRLIDRAFEWSAAATACVLALCMGCMTDFRETKPFFCKPLALIACLITQHILIPPIACGLHFLFNLPTEIGLGLMITSAMPGGGMAHLTVYLMTGERHLSAAISFMNSVLNLVMTPVWLAILCYVFQIQIHYLKFVIWLVPLFISQMIGAIIATCRNSAAQGLLNWIGRPILLLSSILIVTLGIYINHYAIDHLQMQTLFCVLVFIATNFSLGGLVGIITKQSKPKRKSMAAEAACFACLMTIPAIRNSMQPPTSDLATIIPLAGTILTPTPIIIYLIAHKAKGIVMSFIDKRKEKQSRHYSIVSSLAKMAEEVTAVSTPLAMDADKDEFGEKQKVTTL